MALNTITPVLITKDEEPNLARTLESLRWAPRVVIVDSGSTDRTIAIAKGFPNVELHERPWSGFAGQWDFAIHQTGIDSAWVLTLDADMSVSPELERELETLAARTDIDGVVIPFRYEIDGTPLWASLYPPQLRLMRHAKARVIQRGHTHEFQVSGRIERCRHRLVHDDRKSLDRFIVSQLGYSRNELPLLLAPVPLFPLRHVLRKYVPFFPEIVTLAAYLLAGGPFRGAAARRYALERLFFEAMLRYRLLEERRDKQPKTSDTAPAVAEGALQESSETSEDAL